MDTEGGRTVGVEGPAAPLGQVHWQEPLDQAGGVLLGLAAGDRNGGPVELAVRLAESLAELGAFDARDVFRRYLAWHAEGAFDTGPVTGRVLALAGSGLSAEQAAVEVDRALGGRSAGCNAAHRVAPLAMAAFLPDSELASLARVEASLTHRHPLAGDAGAAVAVLCRALIRGVPWPETLARAAEGRLPETAGALDPGTRSPLSTGGFAPETLRAAVHFVDRASGFEEALGASLRFAGPANYCPVLVGALGGARWGARAIPCAALAHCRDLPRIERVAARLAAGWSVASKEYPP